MSLFIEAVGAGKLEKLSYCPFCTNIFRRNEEQGLPKEESILYEDDFIYVMPDICPLSVGHLLIISKRHAQGYANTDKATLQAVECFLTYYEERIGFRNYTIFEHGAVIPYHAGASIDHAHIHIVPYQIDMSIILDNMFLKRYPCQLNELLPFGLKKQPYLYYRVKNEETGFAYPVGDVKSQVLRDIANRLLRKKKFYDWKQTYWKIEAYTDFFKTLTWWRGLAIPATFKWQKKLVLEICGLATYCDILSETNRFQMSDINLVMHLLEKELQRGEQIFCRLVLVPAKHQYKLPNYVVRSVEDLRDISLFLQNKDQYQELWYFTESTSENEQILSGRLSYHRIGRTMVEYIELVSDNSPREIEAYSQDSDIEYMRVSKRSDENAYLIESIQTGRVYSNEDQWRQAFFHFSRKLEAYNTGLFRFQTVVSSYKIHSMSLDFKLEKDRLSFIDWDTSDDSKILEAIFTDPNNRAAGPFSAGLR